MKDHLRELVAQTTTTGEAGLIVREYLQARVLEALQRAGAFSTWAFLGGTALRFLYRLRRFSEDLDFSRIDAVRGESSKSEAFERFVGRVRSTFEAEAYQVDIRARADAVVQSASVGFPGLLYELGLSRHEGQKISIKIEVDTHPPPHAGTETSLVRRHVLVNLLHYDRSSLFAGKLHALIQRPYIKGRDVYDLVWYLSDPSWPSPNLALLEASLAQTGMRLSDRDIAAWRSIVADRISEAEWDQVVSDVRPFLEQAEEVALLNRENVLQLLKR
jgi:predicted nucleotidyltransferase component of viral defense system